MQITSRTIDGVLELQVAGRLDAYWADHFTTSVLTAVREGHHRIQVDLSGVDYISSAGLGALMHCYQELRSLSGTLRVAPASPVVQQMLKMTGLLHLLVAEELAVAAPTPSQPSRHPTVVSLPHATLDIHHLASEAGSACRIAGREPVWMYAAEERCRRQTFGDSDIGIGVGAPGGTWADCRDRMGEYLSVSGCVAFLPTDNGNTPDYLLSAEQFVPELQTLQSVQWQGTFSHLIRFEAAAGSAVALETLAEQALAAANADVAGIVAVGEIEGLVGAAWCRSPAQVPPGTHPTKWPDVREWLAFTTERSYARSSGLIVGVVATTAAGALAPWVRPLGAPDGVRGHCHAVAFSYRPLPKGIIDLNATVRRLFEAESPRGLLHLLNDDRPLIGSGQSALTSGACWVVPISTVDVEN